jgi:hypothetical protein
MTAMVVMEMGRFLISTDRSKLDVDVIHKFLARSYWAEGIPRETVVRSIENSLCFGVYDNARQISFARVISDFATYAYVADVFILEPYRERSLGAVRFQAGRQHASAHSHGNRGSRDLFAFLNSLRARPI